MSVSPRSDLRSLLRDGTHDAHERLDAKAMAFDLADRADYARFLVWQGGLVPGLEAHLARNGIARWVPDWNARRRADALIGDIARLGAEPPRARALDGLAADGPGLIGICYVLEGSRVGGAMLVKLVDPALKGVATAYLDHGADQRLWPRFIAILNGLAFSPQETEAAVAAARRTFALFESALDADMKPSRIRAAS